MIGAGLELQILIVCDEGVEKESNSEQRDDEQSKIDTFVEVDVLELLLLGEGRTVDFPCILNLLIHINFAIGILYMQYGEEAFSFG